MNNVNSNSNGYNFNWYDSTNNYNSNNNNGWNNNVSGDTVVTVVSKTFTSISGDPTDLSQDYAGRSLHRKEIFAESAVSVQKPVRLVLAGETIIQDNLFNINKIYTSNEDC